MGRLVGLLLYGCGQLLVQQPRTREERAMWLHRLCRRGLRMFGVAVEVSGIFPERGMLISNHMSYLDIVVFASIHPCVFVSKAEIRTWPLLGWMTTMAGTVYVVRGRGGSAREAGAEMRGAAADGLPVVFFPEGTTSNGAAVMRFHSGLLAEGMAAGQPVTAARVRYALSAGNGGQRVSDVVAYWGEHVLVPHVFHLFSLRGVRAQVRIGATPIVFADPSSRKQVAVEAREAVCGLGAGG